MNDWDQTFLPMVRAVWAGQNPYDLVYVNPPWLFLPLAPFFWVPWWLAMAFTPLVLIWASVRARKPYLLAIVGTSFPFIALTVYANIDWVAWIGIVLGGSVGAVLNSAKPQVGVFSILADLKNAETWRKRAIMLAPAAVIALISTIIYPEWISAMFGQLDIGPERNATLFPWLLPLGIYALWRTWRDGDRLWGVGATLCIAPYYYIASITPFLFLVADRNWKWGVALNVLSWVFVILVVLEVIPVTL
ncbi:MAG: hypothetical protein AAFU54_15180 [Chloroflexota bacterium]